MNLDSTNRVSLRISWPPVCLKGRRGRFHSMDTAPHLRQFRHTSQGTRCGHCKPSISLLRDSYRHRMYSVYPDIFRHQSAEQRLPDLKTEHRINACSHKQPETALIQAHCWHKTDSSTLLRLKLRFSFASGDLPTKNPRDCRVNDDRLRFQ